MTISMFMEENFSFRVAISILNNIIKKNLMLTSLLVKLNNQKFQNFQKNKFPLIMDLEMKKIL